MTHRVDSAVLALVYGDGADQYDAVWSPVISPAGVDLVDALELGAAASILDIGAGTGALTDALRSAAPRASIVSVDPSAAMLRIARDQHDATATVADAGALPCAGSSVDAVLLAYVLFHLLDPLAGLREATRVVRPGGRVGTVTWASESPPQASKVWESALAELGVPTLPAHGNHDGLDTTDAITALLKAAGLHPTRVWMHGLEHRFTAESFWTLRTGCGGNRARLAALDPETREQMLPELRARFDGLSPDDYTFHGEVICAIGEKRDLHA